MVSMYCLYHGRQGLRNIATKIHILTCDLAESIEFEILFSNKNLINYAYLRFKSWWKFNKK